MTVETAVSPLEEVAASKLTEPRKTTSPSGSTAPESTMRLPLVVVPTSSFTDVVRTLFVNVNPQSVVVVVLVVVVVVVVVVSQTVPAPHTPEQQSKFPRQPWSPSGIQATHMPVVVSQSDMAQLPQEPPQPSPPQFRFVQFGTQQVPPTRRAPLGQQRPKRAVAFLAMGFAQFRLQQLMFVEHTLPFDLQSARASRGAASISAAISMASSGFMSSSWVARRRISHGRRTRGKQKRRTWGTVVR